MSIAISPQRAFAEAVQPDFSGETLNKADVFERVIWAKQANNAGVYFNGIRRIYAMHAPEIEAGNYDPLFVDWKRIFTPIEHEAWTELRANRLMMFPQYPALHYFFDFADPWRKLAIECDGKAWHDAKRDHERDRALYRAEGWTIFRFSGRELWRDRIDDDGEESPPRDGFFGVTMREIYEIWGSK